MDRFCKRRTPWGVAITRPEARTNAQKGLSGKESDALRVVGQAWDHILGASGAREDR